MKTKVLFFTVIILLLCTNIETYSQNVTITDDDSYTGYSSAMLDIMSSDKGMLVPRIDFNNKPTNPAVGLLVYVTTNGPEGNNMFYYFNGTVWHKIPTVPNGASTGDLQYWNGTEWTLISAGTTGQILTISDSGIPE